jgi:hypothetical protein
MSKALVCTIAMLLGGQALAAEPVDSATFYASRPGQVFKAGSSKAMTVGYMEGDETPYQSWEGRVSGKKVYLELHGDQFKMQIGRRWTKRSLGSALKLATDASAEKQATLDAKGTELYVRSDKVAKRSVLCLESLLADASRVMPFRSVYVVTDLLASPRLYRLPALYGSCQGLVDGGSGGFVVPAWSTASDHVPATFSIRYLRLGKVGFAATDQTYTATSVGDHLDEFIMSSP